MAVQVDQIFESLVVIDLCLDERSWPCQMSFNDVQSKYKSKFCHLFDDHCWVCFVRRYLVKGCFWRTLKMLRLLVNIFFHFPHFFVACLESIYNSKLKFKYLWHTSKVTVKVSPINVGEIFFFSFQFWFVVLVIFWMN